MLTEAEKQQFIRDGFVIVRGLLPPDLVATTRERVLAAMGVDPSDPATWSGKGVSDNLEAVAATDPCRTDAVEAVSEQLVGPHFSRGLAYSPFLEARGVRPFMIHGYIPVLRFPEPGPKTFERPRGYHIDGAHVTTLWPGKNFLVIFAYLTDTPEYGGATAVLPGSHRQVFEHWVREDHPGSTAPPDLEYAEPVPFTGEAGDVLFMHYLTVHSSTSNRSDHIRVGLNTAVLPDEEHPYERKSGPPRAHWTALDWTLRTDDL